MNGSLPFRDRRDAGEQLAARLTHLESEHPLVLGLPRGGVPVAALVAARLHAPLDILVVRKLGVPFQPELAMGAVGEEGARVLEPTVIRQAGITAEQIATVETKERAEIERRAARYRDGRTPVPLSGRVVVIVDDGIATGSTALAAIQVARHRGAARVVLAAPVAAAETARELLSVVDELVCVATPEDFGAVGRFYRDFSQTSDDEVTSLLATARTASEHDDSSAARRAEDQGVEHSGALDQDVEVLSDGATLEGRLTIPAQASGIVLFAHGSGSSARSPRNRFVADRLHDAGIGTLLFDLLTPLEADDRANVFDIELLARRLRGATGWTRELRPGGIDALGYFGASTGAAAALEAAADPRLQIDAVVSRGGRVDLAADHLDAVRAPTLMIVGGADAEVLQLNRAAARLLRCPHEVVVVPGASHLFEEPGALDAVAGLASGWFAKHLGAHAT
ncbi:MAG: phosphoribosyltransferase [Acidimicrobiia bacterium]|nr:phosphoribosyltransferase [Acidimicrobiia bacterium]